MRAFHLILIFGIAALFPFVLAAGGASSSGTERYTTPYDVRDRAPRGRDEYAELFRQQLRERLGLPGVTVENIHLDAVGADAVARDMNHNRNLRRFLYLGKIEQEKPAMILATPLTGWVQPDGSQPFALLTAHRGRIVQHHGFVKVSDSEQVRRVMNGWVPTHVLEPGFSLTIDEMFNELQILRHMGWAGRLGP